jgi:hypothetical protein
MRQRITEACRPYADLSKRVMTSRFVACAAVSFWIGVTFNVPVVEAAALPTVDEIMKELKLSDSDQKKVRQGDIVDWSPTEGSDRELALGMVFLVKAKKEDLFENYRKAMVLREVSVITAHGTIAGEGSMEELAGVELKPNGEKEANRYLNAKPGDELNLDAKEMAAFQALKSARKDGAVPVKKVEELIRQGLLARYQTYHKQGLAGIAPYERGDGKQRRAGDELLLSTKQLSGVAKHLPTFHNFLLNYPNGLPKDEAKNFEEFFYWLNIDVFGRPTYVLVHRILYHVGDAAMAVERQYYASHDYNSMLQGIAAIPTKEGMFLFYVGRVSTDQVAGFSSAALHPVSRAITAPYIKDMFRELQAKAAKKPKQ